ncbi:hypothetical protein [Bacteriovorax sp. Seq25_V]|uniref:hypothetical protein n=1 Tax=Bacteriovorax sp. Seq25_V TaxID=1201288 RepID=UPI000389FBC3|nr:hypothetical protein [Bacteriovorax sp. Seq25_V]EQC46906.1 hypothetical protein M900_2537 [Bacteriovorax sp. Seq25_V]
MKAVKIMEVNGNEHRTVNYVYNNNGIVENRVIHLTHINEDINRVISEGLFNPAPHVSTFVFATENPILFIDSLRTRYCGKNYVAIAVEEEEILAA